GDIVKADQNNIGPKLGVAWDTSGKPTMTVRGSYEIAYDIYPDTTYAQFSQANYGSTTTVTLTPFARLSDQGFYGKIMPVPTPQLFANLGFTRDSRAYAVDPNIRTPYVESWSFRIGHQIGTSWKVEAAYVRNHAVGE